MTDIFEYLSDNAYPGRGIIAGHYNGECVIAYFIMGRSPNSRNRIFAREDGMIVTRAFDESKVTDPSLIIYHAFNKINDNLVITNGAQTDAICQSIKEGKTMAKALKTWEYEPDAPNYTPRISAVLTKKTCQISILKNENGKCLRKYYHYKAADGIAHFISTYDHDGNPLPSFSQKPIKLKINEDIEEFAHHLYNSLNYDNKISLYVRFGDRDIILNKNEGD
jgi:IMP cyclohydrolase